MSSLKGKSFAGAFISQPAKCLDGNQNKDPEVLRRIQDWLYRDGNDGRLTEPQQQFHADWAKSSQEHLLPSSIPCSISTSLFLNLCCQLPHLSPAPHLDQHWILISQYLTFIYKLSVFSPTSFRFCALTQFTLIGKKINSEKFSKKNLQQFESLKLSSNLRKF